MQAKQESGPLYWKTSGCFRNRVQAAEWLAQKLDRFRGQNPLVLGIPRGAVPMAQVISDRLDGSLDVVLVRKIGAPENPEFAIGSVSEFGAVFRSEQGLQGLRFHPTFSQYFEKSALKEIARLKERRRRYSPVRPPISPKERLVIIVDDGIATGSTMLAAVRAIRSQNPEKIVVAVPLGSPQSIDFIKKEADEVVVLETPEDFFSISQFYEEFPQVSDEEVIQFLLNAEKKERN